MKISNTALNSARVPKQWIWIVAGCLPLVINILSKNVVPSHRNVYYRKLQRAPQSSNINEINSEIWSVLTGRSKSVPVDHLPAKERERGTLDYSYPISMVFV